MIKLTSALTGMMLMLALTVGAYAQDCCDKDKAACCKGGACCAKKLAVKK